MQDIESEREDYSMGSPVMSILPKRSRAIASDLEIADSLKNCFGNSNLKLTPKLVELISSTTSFLSSTSTSKLLGIHPSQLGPCIAPQAVTWEENLSVESRSSTEDP